MVFLFFEKVDVYLLPDKFSVNAGIFLHIIYTVTDTETASFPVFSIHLQEFKNYCDSFVTFFLRIYILGIYEI